ncbi:MAG TPA: 50S ribosomal protein L25 [Nitrospirae bacterium]|nr:50S ribosomal protein L25 [Nitrospirota bacterium]HDZ88109.1 50S ribosomal protein L25 [Nitrospirota bacterium]
MERVSLNAELRDATGKSVARKLRREGFIPGVIYREGKSQPIRLNRKEAAHFINASAGEQGIVELNFNNGDKKIALLKDIQVDPVDGELLHTDFFEVSMMETITVTVPVIVEGVAVGVKRDGGILQKTLRDIEIECLPDKIPGHFMMDISGLEIGDSIHVKDIEIPEGVTVLSGIDEVLFSVVEPAKVEEEAPAEIEEAAAEEPEVEKKGKKEEAGAGEHSKGE